LAILGYNRPTGVSLTRFYELPVLGGTYMTVVYQVLNKQVPVPVHRAKVHLQVPLPVVQVPVQAPVPNLQLQAKHQYFV